VFNASVQGINRCLCKLRPMVLSDGFRAIWVLVALLMLSGCDQRNQSSGHVSDENVKSDVVVMLTKEEQLKVRVVARWDALIARDAAAAHKMISTGMRTVYSIKVLKALLNSGTVLWRNATVQGMACTDQQVCRVDLRLTSVYMGSVSAMRGQEMQDTASEAWVWLDNEWWYVPNKIGLGGV